MTPLQTLTEALYKALNDVFFFGDMPVYAATGTLVAGLVGALQSVGAPTSSLVVRVPTQDPAGADFARHYLWVDGQPMMFTWTDKATLLPDEQAACDRTYEMAERQEGPGMGVPEASYEAMPAFDPALLEQLCKAAAPELDRIAAFVLDQNTARSPRSRSAMRL